MPGRTADGLVLILGLTGLKLLTTTDRAGTLKQKEGSQRLMMDDLDRVTAFRRAPAAGAGA